MAWNMIMVNILAQIIVVPVNILLAALNIKVLDIIIMELILHNPQRHITLMLNSLANHLNLPDQTNKHTIILIEIIYLVSYLSMMIMMSWCLIAIQYENDYISKY